MSNNTVLPDLDLLKDESIIPLGKGKKYVIKEIHECSLLPRSDIDQSISILDNRICQYRNGNDKMELGVLHTLITQHIQRDEELSSISKKIIIIKLRYYDDKDLEHFSFMILDFTGFIYFMGALSGIKTLKEFLEKEIYDISNDSYNSIFSFSPRFLLWLVLKLRRNDSELMKDVVINQITGASVNQMEKGGLNYGKIVKVLFSKDITKSLPILISILRGHKIDSCTFEINFQGYLPPVQIRSNERIGFVSSGFFRKFNYTERFVIGIHIVHLLIKIYYNWKSGKDIKI